MKRPQMAGMDQEDHGEEASGGRAGSPGKPPPEPYRDPDERPEPPHYVAQRVRDALAQDSRVGELDIRVRITGNRVFLTGNVATRERQRAVTEVVGELLPGYDISNETSVHEMPDVVGEERLS